MPPYSTKSGNSLLKVRVLLFHSLDSLAYFLIMAGESGVQRSDPVVMSSETMKLRRPSKIVPTDQLGLHVSGWKLDMLKQSSWSVTNRPFGVVILMPGALYG